MHYVAKCRTSASSTLLQHTSESENRTNIHHDMKKASGRKINIQVPWCFHNPLADLVCKLQNSKEVSHSKAETHLGCFDRPMKVGGVLRREPAVETE